MSVVLMYHSLYRNNDVSDIDVEDLPYAVSEANFISQIDRVANRRSGLFSVQEDVDVVITFDDGHRSNLDIAVPLLVERGLKAYFFITTGFTNLRKGFLSSDDIQALSRVPGMEVGSHGVTHQFFNDMSVEVARRELIDSKLAIEKLTNHPCESMSFPGGRYNKRTLGLMKSAGYSQWFGSDIGMVDSCECFVKQSNDKTVGHSISAMTGIQPINRVAIRRDTQLGEFEQMISPDYQYYRSQVRKNRAKKVLQKTLGNRLYYGLYK